MHNAGFAAAGLDWRYVAFEVAPDDLEEALRGAQKLGFAGVNLTVPHKEAAVALMDCLDPTAEALGAVNTVVWETETTDGEWAPAGIAPRGSRGARMAGYNTDADALTQSLREDLGIEPRSARVVLLGAGGAARAAAFRLAEEGVGELWLVNRTASKAEALAREITERHPAVAAEAGYPPGNVELVINGTSAGLAPGDPLPLCRDTFDLGRADGVYDMIYRPAETPLLRLANEAGCRTANGLGMLLRQGAAAFELWTRRAAPMDVMKAALERAVSGDV